MTKLPVIIAAGLIAMSLGGCASQPHRMFAGSHPMAPKAGSMPDRAMPERSSDCSERALKKMPPEHRRQCEAAAKAN